MEHHVDDREKTGKDAKTSLFLFVFFFFKGSVEGNFDSSFAMLCLFCVAFTVCYLHFKLYPQ